MRRHRPLSNPDPKCNNHRTNDSKNPYTNDYSPASNLYNTRYNNYNTTHKNGYNYRAPNFYHGHKNGYNYRAPNFNRQPAANNCNNGRPPPYNTTTPPPFTPSGSNLEKTLNLIGELQYELVGAVVEPLNDILSSIGEKHINVPLPTAFGGVPNPFYKPDPQNACTTMCPMGKVHASDGSCRCVAEEDDKVPNRPDNKQCNIMCPKGHTLSTDGSCKCIRTCTNKCPEEMIHATDGSCECIPNRHGMPPIEEQIKVIVDDINTIIKNTSVGILAISKRLPCDSSSGTYHAPLGKSQGYMRGGSRRSRVKKSKKTLRNRRS